MSVTERSATFNPSLPLIEIGIITIGRFDGVDRRAIQQAGQAFRSFLSERFPEFSWRIAWVVREDLTANIRNEPSALLQDGSQIREARGWDYGFVITPADLKARYKPYALAALSNALDLAVISTSRIDPQSYQSDLPEDTRLEVLIARLTALLLHAFGHLNGLIYKIDETHLIPDLQSARDIPQQPVLSDAQCDAIRGNLYQTADLRLEEQDNNQRIPLFYFYMQSAWINRHEIFNAIRQARPWQFPVRLVKLSAAALSALFILLLTAEVWHLALSQTLPKVALLLMLALVMTTVFVTIRQRLFVQRTLHQRSEQSVITNVSAASIVLLGMLTMAALLLTTSMLFSVILHPAELIVSWTDSLVKNVTLTHHLLASFFVTTLGLMIGALGASFEDQYYFRHIVFVDEEA